MADATLSTSGHPKEGDPLLAPSVHYLECLGQPHSCFEYYQSEFRSVWESTADNRTGFCEELEAAGFSRASRVCELEQHVVRAKGAQVLCPRLVPADVHEDRLSPESIPGPIQTCSVMVTKFDSATGTNVLNGMVCETIKGWTVRL